MGNWKLTRCAGAAGAHRATCCARCASGQPAGLSRRQLIRRSIGAGVGLWLLEVTGGTSASCGPTCRAASAARSQLGDIDTVGGNPAVHGATLAGRRARRTSREARSLRPADRPDAAASRTATAPTASGSDTNVRTLYQRCPHLGCKPNFCTINYWFECPCHGSRYDRLGTKVQRARPGAAQPRPLRAHGRGRRADRRHQQDHPRPAAGRARPAGPHPGHVAHRAAYERRADRPRADAPRAGRAGGRVRRADARSRQADSARRRALLGRPAGAHGRADRGARRPDRQPERQRAQCRLPGRAADRALHPASTGSTTSASRRSASRAGSQTETRASSTSRTWRAATPCSSPTARAATATTARAASARRSTTRPSCTTPSTAHGRPGTGHLNPNYIHNGADGRRPLSCAATPNSVMPAWLQPNGPLNYREVEELIKFITASKDTTFVYQPQHVHAAGDDPAAGRRRGLARPELLAAARRDAPARLLARAQRSTAAPRHAGAGDQPGHGRQPARDRDPGAAEPASGSIRRRRAGHADRGRAGETVQFEVNNTPASTTTSTSARDRAVHGARAQRPARHRHVHRGHQTFTWTVDTCPTSRSSLQFACTVPGHYQHDARRLRRPALGRRGSLMAQQALPPAPSAAAPSSACSTPTAGAGPRIKATFWFLLIVFLLGYIPDLAYYFTVSPHGRGGLQRASARSTVPGRATSDLPCPAPAGAVMPWQTSPAELALPGGAQPARWSFTSGTTHLPHRRQTAAGRDRERAPTTVERGRQPRAVGRGSGAARAAQPTPRSLNLRRAVRHRRPRCVRPADADRLQGHRRGGRADRLGRTAADLALPVALSDAAGTSTRAACTCSAAGPPTACRPRRTSPSCPRPARPKLSRLGRADRAAAARAARRGDRRQHRRRRCTSSAATARTASRTSVYYLGLDTKASPRSTPRPAGRSAGACRVDQSASARAA